MAAGISLAGAILIGSGLAAAGGVAAASMSASAARSAASQNRYSQKQTNQMNYDMWRQARGEGGSAVLPLYLNSADGGLFEDQLGKDLVSAYDSTAPDRGAFDAVTRSYEPAVAGARDTANGIFNGGTERQMLDNFAPVAKARVKFKRQSAMDALNKTLGEINAVQAGRGFSGDSLGNRMLKYRANAGAADAIAGADLSNIEETRGIKDAALKLKLNNLDLPFSMAGKEMDYSNLGNTAYLDAVQKRMVPFNFLRLGTAQPFQYQPLTYTATPSTGQLVAQGVGQLAGTATNYLMQNQQNQKWGDYLNNMNTSSWMSSPGAQASGAAPSNFNSLMPSQQLSYATQVNHANDWIANNPQQYAAFQ